jgi:hypothetical protein
MPTALYQLPAGDRHDAVYVGTAEADVMFCPGSRTHFELLAREVNTVQIFKS